MKRYRKIYDPAWEEFQRLDDKRREYNRRRLYRRRQARAFSDGAFQAAVNYWSRLRYCPGRVLRA